VVEEREGCGRPGRVGATWWKNARAAADRGARRALREGERVDVRTRDGEFVRVRTIAGRAGWLAGRDLGALTE
jgi:hypothetical protein